MDDRPARADAPPGRRLIPEQVHAAAFLTYTLAVSMLGFAVAGSRATFAEPTGQTFDGTPCYGTTGDGICQKSPPGAPALMVLALLLLERSRNTPERHPRRFECQAAALWT
ncbi:hypothetical protein [Actinoallomurus iriomotensis]|uniref:Uncharacterized protein n=1 Tax=Actinoallomurus iriomotensis TaxID=478107 RepID=A0A9W6W077_9ACTN|nr:hypothetical protein [Actinoallomurus iriomotensis]GLY85477.1 hypothetical protein Airi02_034060 [Actinoallomurus iriomotensis]